MRLAKLKKTKKIDFLYMINVFMFLINCLLIFFLNDKENHPSIFGGMIILTSIFLLFRVKKTKMLFYLFAIIAYLNISLAIVDLVNGGDIFNDYQIPLRNSVYNLVYGKSILLNISVVSLFITPSVVGKAITYNQPVVDIIDREKNWIISSGGILFIIYAQLFGYSSYDSSGYVSNAKTIVEYSILVFLIVWFYSKGYKIIQYTLGLLALVYILQGLYHGDRSSSMVLIIMIVILQVKKIEFSKMISFAVGGVFLANLIATYRNAPVLTIHAIAERFFSRGILLFFSDTASFSYYAGLTILAARELVNNKGYYVFRFILGIFGGSSIVDSNLTLVAKKYFYNAGGGLYPSYFYFWGGYLGVIFGASILAIIIRFVFTKKTNVFILLQVYLTTMVFRWYLYTPMTFFRTSIVMFLVIYLVTHLIHVFTKNQI